MNSYSIEQNYWIFYESIFHYIFPLETCSDF